MRHRTKAKSTREQQRIISFGIKNGRIIHRKPLVVSAGAGTGKTETIADFVARRVELGIMPKRILVLAFNRKAAGDLDDRVNASLARSGGSKNRRVRCATFHAAGLQVIRQFAKSLEFQSYFTISDENSSREIMQSCIKPSDADNLDATTCLRIYSVWKGSLRPLTSFLGDRWPLFRSHAGKLKALYGRYDAAKRESNVVDYDDMLVLWDALLTDKGIRHKLRAQFDYVIVDEYQDTNPLQDRIVRRMCQNGDGLVLVGDDDQCICSYRGVEYGAVERQGQEMRSFTLTRNFRSTQPVLDACNALIAPAVNSDGERLWSKNKNGARPELIEVGNETMLARLVVGRVQQALKTGVALTEQVVLARTSEELQGVARELDRQKVPYQMVGGSSFLNSPEIASMIALLKWVENPKDRIAAGQALDLCGKVGAKTQTSITGSMAGGSAWKRLRQPPDGVSSDHWNKFKGLLKSVARGSWANQLIAMHRWFREQENRSWDTNARKFVRLASSFNNRSALLDAICLEPEAFERSHGSQDRLTLSTIHSAKGKEWASVYLINAVDGCMPNLHAVSPAAIAEENRVMFVGMTRARQNLTLVMPNRLRRLGRARVLLARTRFLPARMLNLYAHTNQHQKPRQRSMP